MIEVLIENEHNFPLNEKQLENTVAKTFLIHDVTIAQVGVHVVDEARMTELNENYKHHQGATDVLTFVLRDPEQPTPSFLETVQTEQEFGDVFLCYPVIASEAEEQGVSVDEQLAFLTEHGCLHLLGIHHD
ncbi:rRNA maturation RNase YbeY [Candidatus Woesebacteria bacterium]|nr:rRNA maturation RNase YbeY [Candidatus Woesebacteria bacterium]MCD8526982.1 rRNA maturation RNase YbeY [Candidatus Woesebacteria bacterium]MCD8546779.1 rRNA maturation RNase YbeY [Candidatus Woesebacteria bacterium]